MAGKSGEVVAVLSENCCVRPDRTSADLSGEGYEYYALAVPTFVREFGRQLWSVDV